MAKKTNNTSPSGRFTYRDDSLSGMGPNIIDHRTGRVWSMELCCEFADFVQKHRRKAATKQGSKHEKWCRGGGNVDVA